VTAGEALRKYTSILKQAGIDEAPDEAGVLLCHVLKLSKAEIFAQPERILTGSELALLEGLIARRLRHEPSAYITGHREFFGIDLSVDSRVLIPRPETEVLVEAAIQFGRLWVARNNRRMLAADIGTGSGAIAIALALHIPEAPVYAVDISPGALEVAASNVRRHGLDDRITLVQGNLLEQIDQKMDLIVANLPYISAQGMLLLQPEIAGYEPDVALRGGVDGTEVIGKLLGQVSAKINQNGAIFMEIGEGQEDGIMPIIKSCLAGCVVTLIKDLAGINRVIQIEVK
jgi:release factor glutamine methyltransferase